MGFEPGWAAMAARPPTGPRSRRPTRARLLSPPPNKTVQPFAAPQPNAQLPTPDPFLADSSERLGPSGQAAPLVSSPIFPNAIKWSEENLLAVAAGHLVTILNPACLTGPRGFVSLPQSPPFNVGAIHKDDLKSSLLLPFTLARDVRICVRSIAWSPRGMTPNGGCLLAVCTTDYRVKLYRSPHQEFRPEWVEVLDLSQLLYDFCIENDFGERQKPIVDPTTNEGSTHFDRKECRDIVLFEQPSQLDALRNLSSDCGESLPPCQKVDLNCSHMTRVGRGLNNAAGKVSRLKNRSTPSKKGILKSAWNVFKLKKLSREHLADQVLEDYLKAFYDHSNASKDFKPPVKRSSKLNVQVTNTQQLISASCFVSRSYMLASMVLEWSSECMMISQTGELNRCAFLAAGTKAGRIAFWCVPRSQSYCVEGPLPPIAAKFLGFLNAHESWVSAISWSDLKKPDLAGSMCTSSGKVLLLATGDSSGSVKLWSGQVQSLMEISETRMSLPWTLLMKVADPDYIAVTSLALNVPFGSTHAILAIGKGSGCIVVWDGDDLGISGQMACQPRAHKQVVTGLAWTFDGKYLYSCAQDDKLQGWGFDGKSLWPLEHPDCLQLLGGEVNIDVPSSALEFFYGVALSSGSLALSTVRSIASGVVDPMYQSRTQKGMVQIIWIGGQQYSKVEMPLNDITPIWISRTALAFRQIQFFEQAFLLWDVFCVLAFLKFSNLHILKPFMVQFIPNYEDPIKWDQEIRNTLAYLSCRQLQILTVLYRRVLLPNVTTEIVLDESVHAQIMDKVDPNVIEYHRRMEQLWWIEHELRQRLVFMFLLAFKNYRENMEGKYSFLHILSYWVKTNRPKMCPQLVEADWSCNIPVREFCSYCRCPIPFTSIEMAYCHGKEPFLSAAVHKLQRCGVSMQVCGNEPLWVCSCCQRKVSQLAPSCFFSLKLRADIEHVLLTPQTCSEVEPRCPFCGILMTRFLSEFFLTPLAV